MKILANAEGDILAWGDETPGVIYADELPEDFTATASLGKYKFLAGEIIEVEDWTPPEPPVLPGPVD